MEDALESWIAGRCPAPPDALGRRLRDVLGASTEPTARGCVEAAELLLGRLLENDCGARGAALDLLVADSLVTYAFELAADDPATLDGLAEEAMRRICTLADGEERRSDDDAPGVGSREARQ